MGAGRRLALVGGVLLLAGCGKIFPFGERLLPETYGPPFGSALKDNQPHYPHNPAAEERHAAADAAESRHYRSHQACHAALVTTISAHAGGRVERISPIESVGHYKAGAIVHEHRCSDYVLSSRSWCVTEESGHGSGHGGGHGEAHKRAEPGCGGDTSAH